MAPSKIGKKEAEKIFHELDQFDPEFVQKFMPFLQGLYRFYFRCDYTGEDNFAEGPAIYVGNHNGLITWEVLMIFYLWWRKWGASRRALGLAHKIALENPLFKWVIPKLGAIPADPDLASEALKRNYSLLVYPGGEKEAFRPYTERKKIDFYQRKGFIRIALKARVPICPVVSVGAHESYVILHRGEEIAKALGLYDRIRLHGVPITFRSIFFMWCVVTGVFTFFPLLLAPWALAATFVPLPTKMTFHLLPPIDVCAMVDPALSEEENLQRIYDHVLGEMQKVLDEKYAERRLPIVG